MEIDLELYRRDVLVPESPPVRLSVIDIAPDHPERTLLFLHGFGGQATQWHYQLESFSDKNRVLGMDLRGHGNSEKPLSTYSMDEILADISTALHQMEVSDRIVLVGHSFGGAIATEFTLTHPEQIEKLILIASPIQYRLNWYYRTALGLPASILRAARPFTNTWLGAPPVVLKKMYENNMAHWDGKIRFPRLSIPTLVIRGDRDRVFDHPQFQEVGEAIAEAEELNVGASGHMVMLERRKAVNRGIVRFLSDNKSTWRQEETPDEGPAAGRDLAERPWLSSYDEGVPATIAIPPVPLHHLFQSSARRFPNKPAIRFEGRLMSYRRLGREVQLFSSALASLGVEQGDRVMIILPNLPEFVISFFALLQLGATAVFSMPTTEESELLRQIREVDARVLITLEQLKPSAPISGEGFDLKAIILTDGAAYLSDWKRLRARTRNGNGLRSTEDVDGSGIPSYSFKELVSRPTQAHPEARVKPGDVAVIIFTGGTTATPKGVMLSHRNLVANALQARHWMTDAVEGRERFLCVVPFSHSYGMTASLNVPITIGASLIIKPKFEPQDILDTIRKNQPTIFPGVPSMYMAIMDVPDVRKYGVESIKACLSGAAPLPIEVQESFEKLTRGRLVEAYGLTEASPATHCNPFLGPVKEGSIGIPLPSTEARVVDLRHDSRTVPIGQIGELAVRGPQVMLGYWGDPEGTRQTIDQEGWLLTGDIVQMDQEGFFRLIARKVDMWFPDSPSNPAFPRDVEEVLYEIPQVKEAAVLAIANTPIAFVIAKQDAPTAESIIAYCRRRLPPELVPRLVIFVDEFPRTFIGKVLRRELKARYEQQQSQS